MSEFYTKTGEAADILRAFRNGRLDYRIRKDDPYSLSVKAEPAAPAPTGWQDIARPTFENRFAGDARLSGLGLMQCINRIAHIEATASRRLASVIVGQEGWGTALQWCEERTAHLVNNGDAGAIWVYPRGERVSIHCDPSLADDIIRYRSTVTPSKGE